MRPLSTGILMFAVSLSHIAMAQGPLPFDDGTIVQGYEGVKSIFEANCIGCHGEVRHAASLQLNEFPFRSGRTTSSQEILKRIAKRITDTERSMPPASASRFPTADEISQIVAWIELATTSNDDNEPQ